MAHIPILFHAGIVYSTILYIYWIHQTADATGDSIGKLANSNCGPDSTGSAGNGMLDDLDCGSDNSTPVCPPDARYDEELGRCVRLRKKNHKRQTAIVGMPCQENIDCQTSGGGAYCDTTKRCECLPAYVNINGYCWAKGNPGQSCAYSEQCASVSPNSYCADGTCRCNNNRPPYQTIDGAFCLMPGECPTNSDNAILRDTSTQNIIRCGDIQQGSCKQTSSNDYVYNCLCTNPGPADFELQCVQDNANSYCCPSRALACIQPREEGNLPASGGGGGGTLRWWYNSASDSCESFSYRGAGGNANNFQTKEQCDSYCKTMCPRGKPMEDTNGDITYYAQCSASSSCSNANYYCNTEGSGVYSYCCPSSSYVCGTTGGVPVSTARAPDPGDATWNGRNVTRYYYDSNLKQCRQFTYLGYGGTFNNFHSESECRSFCGSSQCGGVGEPLMQQGVVLECGAGGTGVCPSRYECTTEGVCCPSADFVCSLPLVVGDCSTFAERWWFNAVTRSCERFSYSGCQGNFNNFPSYQACTEYCTKSATAPECPQGDAAKESGGNEYIVCSGTAATVSHCPSDYYCHFDGRRYGCCPTRTKTCSVDQQDPGVACIKPVTRWYYNSQTRLCDIFVYNGCDGNSNNFPTKVDCQDYCGVGGCPEGGEPFRETYNGQYRVCGTGGEECPSGFSCSIVTLGTATKYHYCCPTRAYVCSLPQDQGQLCGTYTLNRYFFNTAKMTCESFTYNGCGGNRNNFASDEQCYSYCNSAGCPPGTIAMHDHDNKHVTSCDTNVPNSCPNSYRCIMSLTLQQGVCCGSTAPAGSCPAGQLAYMDSLTNAPLQCQPNVDGSCPDGIFCQYSPALQNSFCCSSRALQCPQGGEPFLEPLTNQARQCTPGLPNVCPAGYMCQATTLVVGNVPSATGYCCGQSNVCGAGYAPYYVNNKPVPCSSTIPMACVSPSTCITNANTHLSYCCVVSGQLTPVCAAGKEPYMVQGAPSLCTLTGANTACPVGYSCDLYAPTNSYYCCRIAGAPGGGACPAPYVLLQPVTPCSPTVANSCPPNYHCMYDSTNLRYVCCGTGAPAVNPCAPNHGQVYMNPLTHQPQECALGAPVASSLLSGCPAGYTCAWSVSMHKYYCCSLGIAVVTGQCPAGSTVVLAANGHPQPCGVGLKTCPAGAVCEHTTTGGPGICCRHQVAPVNIYGCPIGNAYLYPGTQTPLICTPRGPRCPPGYECRHSVRGSIWYCCSNTAKPPPVIHPPLMHLPQAAIHASDMQVSHSRRRCSSNWDCRVPTGKVNLCLQGFCLM